MGASCNLQLIIGDINHELLSRFYELVASAGGWHHRTRRRFAPSIRTVTSIGDGDVKLSKAEELLLLAIAYFQPITRAELSAFLNRNVSRDTISYFPSLDFVASGPRSPQPGAPSRS